MLLNIYSEILKFPFEDPVLKFLLILVIILITPILLNIIRVPHLLGLIIAGALIGPNGFSMLSRDSSIILSGTAGLLYIMFLAGLEIDMGDFKKNSRKSMVFGMYTFIIPMTLGTLVGLYVLDFGIYTSVLLASLFASHTLITYPLVSKLGIAKNRAVNITVGGTVITDTLALLVLAVIVGMTTGEVNSEFWLRLSISIVVFAMIVMLVFPIIARWFFKKFDESVTQYVFVLVMVYVGAVLAELAGIEAIIGAFLAGLSLNPLIPHTSPLMNRIEFVGNAIFIPIFLIGVGMLIDYRVFFNDLETVKVALIISFVATLGKFLAAWFTQKTFRFSADERRLIFGLSNAQAAATLAAVLVGYNIVLNAEEVRLGLEAGIEVPKVRLLNESILNGSILMILVTCTIASFVTQKSAKSIAVKEAAESGVEEGDINERILIPLSNLENTEEMVNLAVTIKSKKNTEGLVGLSVIESAVEDDLNEKQALKILNKAVTTASSVDVKLQDLLRYDLNVVNGITNVVRENKITDIILGLHNKKGISDSFLGHLTKGILMRCNQTTFIYKPVQPLSTIKRHIIVVPEKAELEIGFPFWVIKLWNLSRNTGALLHFHGTNESLEILKGIAAKHPIQAEFTEFADWEDILVLSREVAKNDNLILLMSRKDHISYQPAMNRMHTLLNKYFTDNSYILIYPIQTGVGEESSLDLKNPSFLEPIEKLDEIGKTIVKLFTRKQ
jgi:Kef-type K+ transport system membrane component KefB/nucleotide-binding universal stress UspA family protein